MTRKEFLRAAGINNRQRLQQLMRGYKRSDGKFVPPVLIEGEDFLTKEVEFFDSALKKLKKEKAK